eukprot:195727-Amorphochlora_amoeboformis.AAC.1
MAQTAENMTTEVLKLQPFPRNLISRQYPISFSPKTGYSEPHWTHEPRQRLACPPGVPIYQCHSMLSLRNCLDSSPSATVAERNPPAGITTLTPCPLVTRLRALVSTSLLSNSKFNSWLATIRSKCVRDGGYVWQAW